MAPDDTKERLLDAAEGLFADHGFAATSLRMITSAAGVNLASVNYHYGSKEALIQAVLERRLGPLNQDRLRRLDAIEAEHDEAAPLPLEPVVEAFIGPALRMSQDESLGGETFMRLLGHTYGEPSEQISRMFLEQFREVAERYQRALCRAIPGLSSDDVFWRLMFLVGAMAHTMAATRKICRHFLDSGPAPDAEELIDRLVPFLVAGMQAPVAVRETEGRA